MFKPKLGIPIATGGARAWRGIVWHHSATSDGASKDWDAINRYHTSYRIDGVIVTAAEYQRRIAAKEGKSFQTPWKEIGYHGGTEWVAGKVEFYWGRPLNEIGAHAGVAGVSNAFNANFIGLCAVGDFDKAPPQPEHWDFNLRLTRALMEDFNIPTSQVIGHREVFDRLDVPRQKTCPGRLWDMDRFRAEL